MEFKVMGIKMVLFSFAMFYMLPMFNLNLWQVESEPQPPAQEHVSSFKYVEIDTQMSHVNIIKEYRKYEVRKILVSYHAVMLELALTFHIS